MIFFLVLLVTHTVFAAPNCPESGTPTGTATTTGPVCEGGTIRLECPAGSLISIVYAMWGRQDQACNYTSTDNTDCRSANATETAQDICNNECSCSILASNSVFGDPCVGTSKYLVLTWNCIEILDCCRCEEFNVAASTCEPSCAPQRNTSCQVRPGCQCKWGYLRDWKSGKCVKKCPIYFPQNPNCTTDEVLDLCGPGCEYTCQNPEPDCNVDACIPGYYCRQPLYRDETTGMCVQAKDCPCYCHGWDSSSQSSSSESNECP